MKQQFVITHQHTILQETEKTWQLLNRPKFKHVMFLRNCLVMQESQFDELCGLQQIAVSWAILP
jgi:hypothetical protein